jgi:hypothetical protein
MNISHCITTIDFQKRLDHLNKKHLMTFLSKLHTVR